MFSLKASRYLTHVLRLSKPAEPVRRLLGRSSGLGHKLGPILLQLPANFRADPSACVHPRGLSIEMSSGVRASPRILVHRRGCGHLAATRSGVLP